MSEMVERASRAYWEANRHRLVDPWEKLHPKQREAVCASMTAALRELETPTEKMVEAGYDLLCERAILEEDGADDERGYNDDARDCFRAMIRAELGE